MAGIATGVLTLLWPSVTAQALVYLIAAWAILTGVFEVVAAVDLRNVVEGERQLAWGNLMQLKQDLGMAKGTLDGATRNRIVGGVVLLIGMIALIGFFMIGSQFTAAIAAAGLFIGGLVFIRALVKMGGAHRSIDTITESRQRANEA